MGRFPPIDKTTWPDGPWLDEPDEIYFRDPATDLPCAIVRSEVSGGLCDYVGVRPSHPLHGVHHDDVPQEVHETSHGGITHSGYFTDREGRRDSNVWYLGFDSGHVGDYMPGIEGQLNHHLGRDRNYRRPTYGFSSVYRDFDTTGLSVCALAAVIAQYRPTGATLPGQRLALQEERL